MPTTYTPYLDYHQGRPSATLPLAGTETVLLVQSGAVVQTTADAFMQLVPELLDASGGPISQSLPASGVVKYIKDDDSGNLVTIAPSIAGQTVMREESITLSLQDESITLQLIGTNWYKL